MTGEPSPRPWRVNGHSIEANDPEGLWLQNEKTGWGVVANLPSCPKSRMSKKNRETWDAIVEANATLIVDAVNQYEWANEEIHRLTVEKDDMFDEAVEIRDERDRLRDIVKRLIEYADAATGYRPRTIEVLSSEHPARTFDGAALLREARKAIGEDKK